MTGMWGNPWTPPPQPTFPPVLTTRCFPSCTQDAGSSLTRTGHAFGTTQQPWLASLFSGDVLAREAPLRDAGNPQEEGEDKRCMRLVQDVAGWAQFGDGFH